MSKSFFLSVLWIALCTSDNGQAQQASETAGAEFYTVEDFLKIDKIDAHIHIYTSKRDFMDQAKRDNFRLIAINCEEPEDSVTIVAKEKFARDMATTFPDLLQYLTTFTVSDFNESGWLDRTIGKLSASLANGAMAVKIYKVIGMWLRDSEGKLVMIDDKRFDPLFSYFVRNKIPVLGHLGEPKNCWLPVEKMTILSDRIYFSQSPLFHMYLHPEFPSYEQQIAARDRVLEKYPELQFVGAHLGSLEWSVDELAARLDKYPNMAVDMASRISHFEYQASRDREKVRQFLIKYQDRLLYATDLYTNGTQMPGEFEKHAHDMWIEDWKFFVTDETLTSPQVDKPFRGLKLPRTVIDKIYRTNAEKWYSIRFPTAPER